jgi:hypothetical protein
MRNSSRLAARAVISASIVLTFCLADMRLSFAGCGGYCQARQARAMCHQAVKVQGLPARQRDAEFERCTSDPASYLELEQLTDDAETGVE